MLNLDIVYNVGNDLIFNPSEFIEMYLFGVPLVDKQGNSLSMVTLTDIFQSAQKEVENWLSIKFKKQVIFEEKDFFKDDYQAWGFIKTNYPVNEAFEIKGRVNTVEQMNIPKEWISYHKSNDDIKYRQVNIVPITASTIQTSMIYNGVVPLGFFANKNIPNYWSLIYVSGFDRIPSDLYNYVGKLAAISIFHVLGDIILGTPGVVSKSISIDGLSQSYSTSSGFKNRIDGYLKDLENSKDRLYTYYKGITILSC